MAAERVPTCVWRVSPELVVALDERFGEPVDAYVNGSQVWLRDDGPGGTTIEWRLHPVPGYTRPAGCSTYDLFPQVALALARGEEVEPVGLAAAAAQALGHAPDATGLVDHQAIGDAWEASSGGLSIVEALLRQLEPGD